MAFPKETFWKCLYSDGPTRIVSRSVETVFICKWYIAWPVVALTHEVEFSHITRSPEVDDCCNTIHFCTKHQIYVQGMKNREAALGDMAQWSEYQPENQRSLVQFPVRAHAWVAGQVPSRGHARGYQTLILLSLSFSLPFSLCKNK